jgi:cytochrome bd-type quinol oxidase subunit 2
MKPAKARPKRVLFCSIMASLVSMFIVVLVDRFDHSQLDLVLWMPLAVPLIVAAAACVWEIDYRRKALAKFDRNILIFFLIIQTLANYAVFLMFLDYR